MRHELEPGEMWWDGQSGGLRRTSQYRYASPSENTLKQWGYRGAVFDERENGVVFCCAEAATLPEEGVVRWGNLQWKGVRAGMGQ